MKLMGIQLGAEDAKKLAKFYTKVFGKPSFEDGEWFGWEVGGGNGGGLMLGPHSEVKGQNDSPGRIMISLVDKDVEGTLKKFEEAGGKVIAKPYQPDTENAPQVWLATVADPDGNYIQIATPWE